ncbi:MAG TPA: acyltransferase family protein [Candidatus Melainabacteria bacterium]|nr:acyltransferase family protein [Candidatus Melainabacteria bacterium]HIN66825.1 acyltransferase family protein [Candidatus Obscuribacterales bacterium]
MKSLKRIFVQSTAELAARCPRFVERYAGKQDDFGLDVEYFAKTEHYLRFLREDWFKTKVIGIENIPSEGAAIIAGNHNGTLPIDLFMLTDAVLNLHPENRLIRFLVHDCFYWDKHLRNFMSRMGEARANYINAVKLLKQGELCGIYPAGERSMGQPLSNKYKIGECRSGCVRAAIETQSPIIPVITVGNVEATPVVFNSKFLANLFQVPYFSFTHFYPWLPYPANSIPLPVKFLIYIGKPIYLKHPPEAASDRELVMKITRELQEYLQIQLDELVALRKSYIRGWDSKELEDWVKGAQHEFATRA